MQHTSIIHRLKQDTAAHHKRVERQFRILDPQLSLQRYQEWLMRLYGYYAPFEEQISHWSVSIGLDWDNRRKTPLLIRDLSYFGILEQQRQGLPICETLPLMTNIAQVFGALYVFEGSTLGGHFIAQHLTKHLQLDVDQGAAFFLPYGSDPRPSWQAFQLRLLEVASTPEQEALILASACNTFDSFGEWLKAMPESMS